MMTRQMLSTVSSGRRPRWRSAMARIIEASRAGRNAEPPPWRVLISINWSMTRPRSIRSSCISASMRSISTLRSARLGFGGWDTGGDPLLCAVLAGSPVTPEGRGRPALCVHRFEEVCVRLGLAQFPEQELDRVNGAHRVEDAAQHVHFLENVRRHEQFLLPGPGPCDIHGREGALVGDFAVEDDLGVPGALELFEDDFVHARTGIDERGGDDRQRAAFFDIPRRAEETLWPLQRVG